MKIFYLVAAVAALIGCSPAGEVESTNTTEEEAIEMSATRVEPGTTEEDELGPDPIEFAGLNEPRGVRVSDPAVTPGYVMFTPMLSDVTFVVDRQGQVVHTWKSDYAPGVEYLLDDGHLLRGARVPDAPRFNGGGQSGRIEKFTWEGELVWSFDLADAEGLMHHDFEPMPNGNILAIAWEAKTRDEAIAAGRDPEQTPMAGLWPDVVLELEPTEDGADVVWEWHSWDHMIQNRDSALPNHGKPAEYPRKIDINAGEDLPKITAEELAIAKRSNRAPGTANMEDRGSDIHHSNAIAYNPDLDQIAISVRGLNEIWVIDHALTSQEASGEKGDLLYRWGDPKAYGRDGPATLGHQHDIRWVPAGLPGAGNLMAFSNQTPGARPPHSQVVEFVPPVNSQGRYAIAEKGPIGPEEAVWTFSDGFFAPFISGAHRLASGNTLVNFGPQGRIVEVTKDGDIVWEYWSPFSGEVRMPDGSHPQPGAPFMYAAFRASFIPADHPALAGRNLEPLSPQPSPSVLREDELAPFRQQAAD